MNKKKGLIGLVTGIVLIPVIVFLCIHINRKEAYSCSRIPLCDGRLHWGMDTDEVIAVAGEPSSMEHTAEGDVLTYDTALPCDFGNCTEALFTIRTDDKIYDGEIFSSGLMYIQMAIDNKEQNSKEAIIGEVADFYGELSPEGGETNVEQQLKEENADFYHQNHFCEAWRADTLPEDLFERLSRVKETGIPDNLNIPLEKTTRLMDVGFIGTEGNPYKIWLDADVLTSYLYLEK